MINLEKQVYIKMGSFELRRTLCHWDETASLRTVHCYQPTH